MFKITLIYKAIEIAIAAKIKNPLENYTILKDTLQKTKPKVNKNNLKYVYKQ